MDIGRIMETIKISFTQESGIENSIALQSPSGMKADSSVERTISVVLIRLYPLKLNR